MLTSFWFHMSTKKKEINKLPSPKLKNKRLGAVPKILIPPEALLTIWVSPTRCWSSGAVPCRNIGWTPWKRLTPHGMMTQLRGLQDDHLHQKIEIFAGEGTRKTRSAHFMQKWCNYIHQKIHVLWFRKLFPIFQEVFSILSPFQNRLHHLSKMFTPVKQQSGIPSNYSPHHKKKACHVHPQNHIFNKRSFSFFSTELFSPQLTNWCFLSTDFTSMSLTSRTSSITWDFWAPGRLRDHYTRAENLRLSMMIHRLSTFFLQSGDRNVFLLLRWLLGKIKHVVILNCVCVFFVIFVLEGKMCQHKSVGGCCTRDSRRHLRHEEKQLITFHLIMGG